MPEPNDETVPPRPEFRSLSLARETDWRTRLIARDERALMELIDLATPWLLGITLAMLSDRDEAEEVVQEAFTIVWNRVHLLDPAQGGILPWLFRITRNRSIDRLRGSRRRRGKAERLKTFADFDPVERPREPNEAAQPGWHVHESVHRALNALPEDQQQVVELAYFQGLTHSEIAGHLGIPMGTVKTRLRLAFDKLRTALAPIKDWAL
jgi:RNA polymerase sigma factor (sigma-70 family)